MFSTLGEERVQEGWLVIVLGDIREERIVNAAAVASLQPLLQPSPSTKDLLLVGKFNLGPFKVRTAILSSIGKVVDALAEAARSGVFLGDAHRVAIQLLGKVRPEGEALGKREDAGGEVVDDAGCVVLFFDPVCVGVWVEY